MEDRNNPAPAQVHYDAATRFLDVQIETNQALDAKAGNIFAVGSSILPVTFGLLNLASNNLPRATVVLLVFALFAYIVLLGCAWQATVFRGLEYRPNLQALRSYTVEYDGDVLQQWAATEYEMSTRLNQVELALKARWTGAANTALYAEGVLLSFAALLALSGPNRFRCG